MSRFGKLPVRIQLLALAILLTLPVLGIIVYSGLKVRDEDYRMAAVETQKLADSLADRQENIIGEAEQLGSLLADLPEMKNRRRDKVHSLLVSIHRRNPQFQSILVADRDGVVWAASIPYPDRVTIADRRYFRQARATMRFSSGEYAVHKVLQTPTLSVAYPLADGQGSFDGVIILSFDLGVMRSILQRSQLPADTNYVLVDHRGIILGRGSDFGRGVGQSITPDALKQMQDGPDRKTFEFMRIDGDLRITTYRKLRLHGESTPYMYIRAGISAREAIARANRNLVHSVALLVPFSFCAFLLAFLIGKRSIADRVAKLCDASKRIAGGGLTSRVAHQVEGGELGELAHAFDEMADRLAADTLTRRRAEEVLQKNEERLRVIIETSQAGIIMVEREGTITFANSRMAQMFGCPMEELLGSSYLDYLHPAEREAGEGRMLELVSGRIDRVSYERRYLRRDGTDFWGFLSAKRLEGPDGKLQALVGIIADITDRKLAEVRLTQSEAKFAAAFRTSPDSININRLNDGRYLEVNEGFTGMLGYSEREAIGSSPQALNIWVDPGERERLVELVRGKGQVRNLETRLRRKDGTLISVLLSSSLMEIDGRQCTLTVARDVTDLERHRNELIKMQKLESLGLLAGGIAHDFNNILTGIMGNISLARLLVDESNEVQVPLAKTEQASLRAAELARQLLVFAKGGQPVKKPVSLPALVRETISLALTGTAVKGVIELPERLGWVEADEGQLNQSFHNIIINAVHAMPEGGRLTVDGDNVRLEEDNGPGLPAGDYVLIRFTDEGCGMEEATLKKIFDPYFSTRKGGSGLGLASAHAIIAGHGGTIRVESTPGSGTTFSVYLPAGKGDPGEPETEREPGNITFEKGRILVMDDEEMVRDLVQRALSHLGYGVETCCDGEEAIERYRAARGAGTPFCLVIMDLTVPGAMGGVEAARRLLALDPDARLVVSSGYCDDPVMANYREYGFLAAIQKPYRVTALAEILTGLLTAGG